MAIHRFQRFALVMLASWLFAGSASAQQVTVGTPMQGINDSFFERFGVNWGFRSRNMFFNQGSFNSAVPQFGGYDPASEARFGFGGRGFSFNFAAGAGSNRSIVSETPMVTIPNGGFGMLHNTSIRPFVTGVVPVVGDRPLTPLQQRLQSLENEGWQPGQPSSASPRQRVGDSEESTPELRLSTAAPHRSSAEQSDVSVAEIRRQQAQADAELAAEAAELIERGKQAEQAGKTVVARIYYEQAARRATGPLRERLEAKIAELRGGSPLFKPSP